MRKGLLVAALAAITLGLAGCAIGFRGPVSDVTETSATLNGVVGSTGHAQGTYWFRYGETSSYGELTPVRDVDFTDRPAHHVSEPITGLSAGTAYHYSLCADDEDPGVGAVCSPDQTFGTYAFPVGVAFAYVTDLGSAAVFQYDVAVGGHLSPLIPPTAATAGPQPSAAAVSPDGESVYVGSTSGTGSENGIISQYDVGPRGALTTKDPPFVAATGGGASGLAFAPDGDTLYGSNAADDTVAQYAVGPDGALSPKSPPTVTAGPNPIAVTTSPDGESVYVANLTDGTISQYEVGASGLLSPLAPPTALAGDSPVSVVVSPDGASVYVADSVGGTVLQYDRAADGALTQKTPPTVAAGSFPNRVAITPNGDHLYVTNQGDDTVSQYDVSGAGKITAKSPATVGAGASPAAIALSPDGASVYVVNVDSDDISQYAVSADGTLTPRTPARVAAGLVSGPIAVGPAP